MNSMSKKEDFDNKPIKESLVALKCGTPGSGTLTLTTVTPATSITVSSLSLDVDDFEDPTIKLEFASNISTTAFTGTINIQVVKLCNNQFLATPVGPQFSFAAVAATEAEPISFFICDCGTCFNDCCTYSVVLTSVLGSTGTVTVTGATLSAIIVGNQGHCCH
jgi:hypothetical protein